MSVQTTTSGTTAPGERPRTGPDLGPVHDPRSGAAPVHDRPLLEVLGLQKHYAISGRRSRHKVVRAVDGVDLTLRRGTTLGIVGESGCGKTTTGRVLAGLEAASGGQIVFDGRERVEGEATRAARREMRALRRRVQMIFQDPMASLDPRMTIGASVAEPLAAQHIGTPRERRDRVVALLERVGLTAEMAGRYPVQFSGGQRQRIGVARALAVGPDVVIADEPTSALDVSVRAQVVNLMRDLRDDLGLAFVFISHDMSTVRYLCDEVLVMYLGRVMERAPRDALFSDPLHPYTRALLSAVPVPEPVREARREQIVLHGELPSPVSPPSGCRFSTRCPMATDLCRTTEPVLAERATGRFVACHYA